MKKCLFLLALVLLALSACGQEPSLGLPTLEEVAALEDMYGIEREEFLERVGVREAELDQDLSDQHADAVRFLSDRTIAGEPVYVLAVFIRQAEDAPKALVQLDLSFELDAAGEDLSERIHALLDEAISLYGEARISGSVDLDICLSWMEKTGAGINMDNGAGWYLGKRTTLSMSISSTKGSEKVQIRMHFQMQPVIP